MMIYRCILLLIVSSFLLRPAPPFPQKAVALPYRDAQTILTALEEALPEELRGKSQADQPAAWSRWLTLYDSSTRARLARGDEDSLVNFLIFGTSFTHQSRLSAGSQAQEIIQKRIEDFIQAISLPGNNERLQFLRGLLEEKGYSVSTPSGRTAVRNYIAENLAPCCRNPSTMARRSGRQDSQEMQLRNLPSAQPSLATEVSRSTPRCSPTSRLKNRSKR